MHQAAVGTQLSKKTPSKSIHDCQLLFRVKKQGSLSRFNRVTSLALLRRHRLCKPPEMKAYKQIQHLCMTLSVCACVHADPAPQKAIFKVSFAQRMRSTCKYLTHKSTVPHNRAQGIAWVARCCVCRVGVGNTTASASAAVDRCETGASYSCTHNHKQEDTELHTCY